MKSIIISLILSCSMLIINAQEAAKSQKSSKLQLLTKNNITLVDLAKENPLANINDVENVISHWMDFDDDGDYDLITVAKDGDRAVCVFKNESAGYELVEKTVLERLAIPELHIMTGVNSHVDIVWFDKNLDGYKDFFMSIDNEAYETEYLSNGDGTFQKLSEYLAAK